MDADDDLTLGTVTSDVPGEAWLGRREQLMDLIHNLRVSAPLLHHRVLEDGGPGAIKFDDGCEVGAGEGPVKRLGELPVVLLERDDPRSQGGEVGEIVGRQRIALKDREVDLDRRPARWPRGARSALAARPETGASRPARHAQARNARCR